MTALLCAGCTPGTYPSFDPLDDLEYPWAACSIDPQTGSTDPNCNESPPAVLQLAIVLRDESGQPTEGLTVDVRSDAERIYIAPRHHLEAIPYPDDGAWTAGWMTDQVWAELSGSTAEDPSQERLGMIANEHGVATAYVLIDSPPKDATGAPVASTVTIETDDDRQTITLTPLSGGGAR